MRRRRYETKRSIVDGLKTIAQKSVTSARERIPESTM